MKGIYREAVTNPEPAVHLRRRANGHAAVDVLADLAGGRVGLRALLGDPSHRAHRFPAPGSTVTRSLRWSLRDCFDRRWWPQGITSSADASDDETFDGRRVLAVSWYAKPLGGVRMGSRISFLDLDTLTYRHVLLVAPSLTGGRPRIDPLHVHAGGIVWHGPYLYVAATRHGLFTARLDDLIRVRDSSVSFGYRYVLPVSAAYEAETDDGVEPLRYSFASLAREGDRRYLVAGEYGRGAMSRRLARYPLASVTSLPAARDDGLCSPDLLDPGGVANMQGAVVVDGRWYVSRSRGPRERGSLCAGEPGGFDEHHHALPVGPEDLTYWPSNGTLWTVTEWPGRRWIVAIDPRTPSQ